ncbi:hypothetical protein J4E89_005588 [Alternaria sp. Ai002NY15]|nr:hypothetical protein J4E89_005588 [Alternaria sp. Ai002NY15]
MAIQGPFRCSNCNVIEEPANPLKRCGGCKVLRYCSLSCQKAHWKDVHKHRCNKPRNHKDENWPEQHMPARIYPHNTHLSIKSVEAYDGVMPGIIKQDEPMTIHEQKASASDKILLNKDEPTTYKLLIESFRAWDETKRCSLGTMVDPRDSYMDATVKYNTGYLFQGLLKHIANSEKTVGILPAWWSADKRDACIEFAKEMYHWDDLPEAGIPKEVNEWRRYGGPSMRSPLRALGMKIEGIDTIEAVKLGYYKVKKLPDGRIVIHNETDLSYLE